MNSGTTIVKRAIAAVPACPKLKLGPYNRGPRTRKGAFGADGLLTVRYRGRKRKFAVEAKASFRPEAIRHLVASRPPGTAPEPLMFVADHVGTTEAEVLRSNGIAFLDSAGNAFLNFDDLYLFVSGRKPDTTAARTSASRLTMRNGLKLVYALIISSWPRGGAGRSLLDRTFRDMASAAGVSLGSVGLVISELKARDHLVEGPAGQRTLVGRKRLAETWVTGYIERLRPKLVSQRYRAGRPQNWAALSLAPQGVLWGGEVAAAKMTGHLKPQDVTLYASRRDIRDLILNWDLRPDPGGGVEVLESFWRDLPAARWRDCVHPLLAYADLLASRDDRNIETARRLYDRHLRRHLEAD